MTLAEKKLVFLEGDYVRDFMFDSLIEAGVVARFLRSSGRVTIGVDPVRSYTNNREYGGSKRRSISL